MCLTISYGNSKAADAAFCTLVASLHPEGMNQPRNITAQRQNDIQDKSKANTFAQQYAQWRQQDRENYSPKAHNVSSAGENRTHYKKESKVKA